MASDLSFVMQRLQAKHQLTLTTSAGFLLMQDYRYIAADRIIV